MAKLQNIKAITQMLEGTHRTQTRTKIGFTDSKAVSERNKKREIGEIWEEYDEHGNVVCIWEQKKGYRVRSGVHKEAIDEIRSYLNSYPNCLPDCRTETFGKLDERFRAKFGRCADCQFRIETKMKQEGTYKEYERQQMLENAKSFFKNADTEIELVTSQISNGLNYVNVDGAVEKWSSEPGMAEKMKSEYEEYKRIVLEKIENLHKQETQE